jgi:hypothetical protein
MITDELVDRGPVEDERIYEYQPGCAVDRPPGNVLLPAFLAALIFGPIGV